MTKIQVIYDNEGHIITILQADSPTRNPVGVPYLNVEIPNGKKIKITEGIGVDVSVTPHQLILEDIPPSEIDVLKQQVLATDELVLSLIEGMYL